MGVGDIMGITKIDERGRITLPQRLREELGLRRGQEIRVDKNERGILLKPLVTKEEFIKELEGCITQANQAEEISPGGLKYIWGVKHAHD